MRHSDAVEQMSLSAVATLAAASAVPVRARLVAAMSGQPEALEIGEPFPADKAIHSYRVRLKLWQHDLLPTMAGFPEFVAAVDAAGDAQIAMAVHEDEDRHRRFILLFNADLTRLLGAAELAVYTKRADQSDDSSPLSG